MPRPTDPRAALAEHLRIAAPSSARLGQDGALLTIDRLADSGVLLVTEDEQQLLIAQAMSYQQTGLRWADNPQKDWWLEEARRFAALSGEVAE